MRTTFGMMLAVCACPAAAEIAVNGGFETGTGPDADNWNEIEVAGGTMGAVAVADRVNADAFSGDWSMALSVGGAADFGPVAEIQQQTVVGSVVGGAQYDFSFWAKGVAGPGSVGFYEVLWFDGDGDMGGGPQGSATGLQTYALNADYTQFTMTGLIAPTSADSVLIQIRLVTGAFDGASGSANIDDVSFTFVPAPASLAAFAGLGLVATRRRV